MEDFIGLIVIFVIYFVFGTFGSKSKKKAGAKREPARQKSPKRERRARMDQIIGEIEKSVTESLAKSESGRQPEGKPEAAQPVRRGLAREGDDPCHAHMLGKPSAGMTAPAVDQVHLAGAGEGEDPCHPGMALEADAFFDDSPIQRSPIFDTEDPDAFARDILRGVVMSEILTRPSQRRGAAGMKRGA